MTDLYNLIKEYYEYRKLTWPNFDNAMKFVMTEVAEVYEIDLARSGKWVRNNPDSKPEFDKDALAKELGDAIMMLIVAGMVEGVNPLEALENKIKSKMGKTVTMASQTYVIDFPTQVE